MWESNRIEFLVRNTFLFIGIICCKIFLVLESLLPEQHMGS